MTSVKVKAYRNVWGSLLNAYAQALSYITCDSPEGTVLPLTWYRRGTSASNVYMDLENGQRSFLSLVGWMNQ